MVPEQTMKSGALLCYKKKELNRGHNGKREMADRRIGTKILTCPLITDICLSNMVLSKPLSVCRGGKKTPVSRCPVSHVALLPDSSLFIQYNPSKQRTTGEQRKVFRRVVP